MQVIHRLAPLALPPEDQQCPQGGMPIAPAAHAPQGFALDIALRRSLTRVNPSTVRRAPCGRGGPRLCGARLHGLRTATAARIPLDKGEAKDQARRATGQQPQPRATAPKTRAGRGLAMGGAAKTPLRAFCAAGLNVQAAAPIGNSPSPSIGPGVDAWAYRRRLRTGPACCPCRKSNSPLTPDACKTRSGGNWARRLRCCCPQGCARVWSS